MQQPLEMNFPSWPHVMGMYSSKLGVFQKPYGEKGGIRLGWYTLCNTHTKCNKVGMIHLSRKFYSEPKILETNLEGFRIGSVFAMCNTHTSYTHMRARAHTRTHTPRHIHAYTHTYRDPHMYVCMYVCLCICIGICVYVCIYVCVHTHTCVYIYVCVHVHVHVRLSLSLYIWEFLSRSLEFPSVGSGIFSAEARKKLGQAQFIIETH